jgi:rSAM/selenodomain-associated transferase 1
MAKAPRAGYVKTRLSAALPTEAVVALYRCLIEDTIGLAQSVRGVRVSVVCPHADATELAAWLDVPVVPQNGDGLAAGLASVFRLHLTDSCERVIAFNGDSPHLPARVLEAAFDLLDGADLVVGPTEDGGYYLVGAKTVHTRLFDAERIGTESALQALLSRARALHLKIALTEPWYDIDDASDLMRLTAELPSVAERVPRTAAWLAARNPPARR